MTGASRVLTSAIVGGVMLLGASSFARAQTLSRLSPLDTRQASFSAGSLVGTVSDDAGAPVEGAVVSALGASTTVAVTDGKGYFEFDKLSPGPYLVRAYLAGHAASRPQMIQVRPSVRAVSGIALHRSNETVPVLAAVVETSGTAAPLVPPTPQSPSAPQDRSGGSASGTTSGNTEETTWRIRHARRSVLKDATIPDGLLATEASGPSKNGFLPVDILGQVAGSSARLASSLFSATSLTGQVNLMTTGSFDTPVQLFSQDTLARNVAFLSVSAPVGDVADWSVRAAFTTADITSWVVAGSYSTRMPARHRYDLGMAYSTQRYDGGNPLALRDVTEGSRNAATVYGYDTIALGAAATLTYGGAYARYDYLDQRNLVSPRAELTITPADRWRVTAVLARQALAPGAEEFLPPGEGGLWLPPQRTFSAIDPYRRFESESGVQAAAAVERDLGATTLIVRTFRQRVADQLVAVFGADLPLQPSAKLGHYFVGNVPQAQADGVGAGIRAVLGNRVHGSIVYTAAYADLSAADDLRYLLILPSAGSSRAMTLIHDVSTSVETEVPETATRVIMFYRVSNGFARPASVSDLSSRPALDGRFDVQLRQSLPFMNFSNAKWEMLFAVRNFFREASSDQFLYDELLVARPPKRLVGGVTLHF